MCKTNASVKEVEEGKIYVHDMTYQVLLFVKSQMRQGNTKFLLTIIKKLRSDRGTKTVGTFSLSQPETISCQHAEN